MTHRVVTSPGWCRFPSLRLMCLLLMRRTERPRLLRRRHPQRLLHLRRVRHPLLQPRRPAQRRRLLRHPRQRRWQRPIWDRQQTCGLIPPITDGSCPGMPHKRAIRLYTCTGRSFLPHWERQALPAIRQDCRPTSDPGWTYSVRNSRSKSKHVTGTATTAHPGRRSATARISQPRFSRLGEPHLSNPVVQGL